MGLENEDGRFEYKPLYGEPEVIMVPPGQFKKWKPTRLQLPTLCPQAAAAAHSFGASALLQENRKMVEAQAMLINIFEEHNTGTAETLDYCLPTSVYVKTDCSFGAGKLRLLPLCNLVKAKDNSKLAVWVEWAGTKYSLSPFTALKDFAQTGPFAQYLACFACAADEH